MLKVGINGFGRIGRAIFRINLSEKAFEVVMINDINPDNGNIGYTLKYDSTYGKLNNKVKSSKTGLEIDGAFIEVTHKSSIDEVNWKKNKVDIVIDSSGVVENIKKARNLKGISKCIVTHSPDMSLVDKTIILGVNEKEINDDDFVLASSICDANAFAPVANLLNKKFGIEHGFVTTLHPWLNYQNLLDGPSKSFAYPDKIHHEYALGRASPNALIPKPTSCIDATCKVLPDLVGKISSHSFRVPTSIVSSAVPSLKLKEKATKDQILELFKEAEASQSFPIFHNTSKPLISTDFIGSSYSVVIDNRWTSLNHNYLKLVLWYDNEWGYSSRVVDLVRIFN